MTEKAHHRVQVRGITIDSESTRDIDDAISVELVSEDPQGWWGAPHTPHQYWRIQVSIADVASLIAKGGMEDTLARKMVTTKYYARGSSPMLPRQLSEYEASLWPNVPRNTITTEIRMSMDLKVIETRVYRSLLVSLAKLSYSDIPKILANPDNKFHELISKTSELANRLLQNRRSKGALALYDLNNGWVSTEEGYLRKLNDRKDTVGYIVIQELMILANSAMSEWAIANDVPILFRNHEASGAAPPREELMAQLESSVASPIEDLDMLRKSAHLVLKRAKYESVIRGHYGLNLPAYTHLTSPIRRYADLINQRQIAASLLQIDFPYSKDELITESEHINDTLQAEKDENQRYWQASADKQAKAHVSAGRVDVLNAANFERVVKVEVRSGAEPSSAFREAFERRLQEDRVPLVCMTTILAEAPRSPEWDKLREILLGAVKPSDSNSILTQAATIYKWSLPTFQVSESGPAHAKTFNVKASVTIENKAYESILYEASNSRDAKQRAGLGLLAAIFSLSPRLFKPEPPTETIPVATYKTYKIEESKNPVQTLMEHAQAIGQPAPIFNFKDTGPGHRKEFTCTCNYLKQVATGSGHSKQAAKTSAARSMVTILANS